MLVAAARVVPPKETRTLGQQTQAPFADLGSQTDWPISTVGAQTTEERASPRGRVGLHIPQFAQTQTTPRPTPRVAKVTSATSPIGGTPREPAPAPAAAAAPAAPAAPVAPAAAAAAMVDPAMAERARRFEAYLLDTGPTWPNRPEPRRAPEPEADAWRGPRLAPPGAFAADPWRGRRQPAVPVPLSPVSSSSPSPSTGTDTTPVKVRRVARSPGEISDDGFGGASPGEIAFGFGRGHRSPGEISLLPSDDSALSSVLPESDSLLPSDA